MSGVRGSGVAGLLHRCSRLNGSKGPVCSTVGSPPRELLVNSCPSSESGSLGGRILHPLRVVVSSCFGVLRPKMEQGFQQLNLCYDLRSHLTISQLFSVQLFVGICKSPCRMVRSSSKFHLDAALLGLRTMRCKQICFQQSLAGEL